jgi:hypothetical protein
VVAASNEKDIYAACNTNNVVVILSFSGGDRLLRRQNAPRNDVKEVTVFALFLASTLFLFFC